MEKETLDAIIETIKKFPNGASLNNLSETLIPKRSLQRYLTSLVKEKRLIATGNARSRRYYLPSSEAETIPLSSIAQSIQANVRQPIQARQPVGYNREFLNNYRPNETYYLSEETRNHLFKIGKSSDDKLPAGTYARHLLNRLLIDLSWNSSRLEGNTYSLLETERLLELGKAPEGKSTAEAQMILNHKAAIEFLIESAEQLTFNKYTILNLHAILSDNLLRDQRACGSLRTIPVGIGRSVYQPLAMPQLIHEYFQQILDTANAIKDPFEQAFFVMVQLPYLQPFLDVNKRVSRLAANIPLIRENLCPLSFIDVPEHAYISGLLGVYEMNRIELLREVFVWAYERSSSLYSATRQELGEPDLFRLKYRDLFILIVGEIVRKCMNKEKAIATIKKEAKAIPANDQAKFIEVAETELMALHEGNIARFRIRPSEYQEWLKTWL